MNNETEMEKQVKVPLKAGETPPKGKAPHYGEAGGAYYMSEGKHKQDWPSFVTPTPDREHKQDWPSFVTPTPDREKLLKPSGGAAWNWAAHRTPDEREQIYRHFAGKPEKGGLGWPSSWARRIRDWQPFHVNQIAKPHSQLMEGAAQGIHDQIRAERYQALEKAIVMRELEKAAYAMGSRGAEGYQLVEIEATRSGKEFKTHRWMRIGDKLPMHARVISGEQMPEYSNVNQAADLKPGMIQELIIGMAQGPEYKSMFDFLEKYSEYMKQGTEYPDQKLDEIFNVAKHGVQDLDRFWRDQAADYRGVKDSDELVGKLEDVADNLVDVQKLFDNAKDRVDKAVALDAFVHAGHTTGSVIPVAFGIEDYGNADYWPYKVLGYLASEKRKMGEKMGTGFVKSAEQFSGGNMGDIDKALVLRDLEKERKVIEDLKKWYDPDKNWKPGGQQKRHNKVSAEWCDYCEKHVGYHDDGRLYTKGEHIKEKHPEIKHDTYMSPTSTTHLRCRQGDCQVRSKAYSELIAHQRKEHGLAPYKEKDGEISKEDTGNQYFAGAPGYALVDTTDDEGKSDRRWVAHHEIKPTDKVIHYGQSTRLQQDKGNWDELAPILAAGRQRGRPFVTPVPEPWGKEELPKRFYRKPPPPESSRRPPSAKGLSPVRTPPERKAGIGKKLWERIFKKEVDLEKALVLFELVKVGGLGAQPGEEAQMPTIQDISNPPEPVPEMPKEGEESEKPDPAKNKMPQAEAVPDIYRSKVATERPGEPVKCEKV